MYVDVLRITYLYTTVACLLPNERLMPNSKKTGQQRNPYVYSKRGLQLIVNYMSQNYSYLNR